MDADALLKLIEDTTRPRALRRKLLEMYTHRERLAAAKQARDETRKLIVEAFEEHAREFSIEPGTIFRDLLKVPE